MDCFVIMILEIMATVCKEVDEKNAASETIT